MRQQYLIPTFRVGILILAILVLFYSPSWGSPTKIKQKPAIAIIIDDMGYQHKRGRRAVVLPGKITYAILPHTPFALYIANLAVRHNKEVILHLPMEPMANPDFKDPGQLSESLSYEEFFHTFYKNVFAIPHISGINNHKGSLLTQNATRMQWLMKEIDQLGRLFFIDSRTQPRSIAYQTAKDYGIRTAQRDIFLDHIKQPEAIQEKWEQLLKLALRKGTALAIGHPYKETLQMLEQNLPHLEEQGIRLVTVNELIYLQNR